MANREKILLGRISKIHGYGGAVIVKIEKIFFDKLPQFKFVFLEIEGRMVPFFLSSSETSGTGLFKLIFEGYESSAKVDEFRGAKVYFTSSHSYKKLSEEIPDLIDFNVFSIDNELVGKISEVIQNPGQWLLKVLTDKNKEILLPFHEDLVIEVNVKRKIIIMNIPEGISDIN